MTVEREANLSRTDDGIAQRGTPSSLKLSELFTMTTKLGDWVNTIWGVHFTLNVAMLGWWFTKPPGWGWPLRLVLTVVYLFLMAVNFYSQVRVHRWLDTFAEELKAVAAETSFKTTALEHLFAKMKPSNYVVISIWHIAVDVFVLGVIWRRT